MNRGGRGYNADLEFEKGRGEKGWKGRKGMERDST